MKIWEIALIGFGVSMDAFAVAMCRGLEMKKFNFKHALIIAAFFGVFQALMPVIGWIIGIQFSSYIQEYDHWIAFGLLVFLGVKLIIDSRKKEETTNEERLNLRMLFLMAIATSIDALAVGVTFAFTGYEKFTSVLLPVCLIGIITFVLSFIGVFIGNRLGTKLKDKAEIVGGVVLILIGLKILLEHLGVIHF